VTPPGASGLPRLLCVATLVIVLAGAMSACTSSDAEPSSPSGSKALTSTVADDPGSGPVCGLIDRDLVKDVVGDGNLTTTGPGALSASARKTAVSQCSIRAADARRPVVQVRLGDTGGEADTWRTRLKGEADEAGVPLTYEDDAWYGYTRDYTSGMYNPGSSLNVVTDEHVVRVTIYQWSGSTNDSRIELAEKIARNAVQHQDEFDK
jgi:hypothetical protein